MPIRSVRSLTSATLVLAVSLAAPARAADTEPGVWWEHTIEMRMQGMSMPATTQKICVSKKGMEEPPGASKDDRCKVTDLKRSAQKMSWKMECSEPPMTGEGEITQGKDSYAGSMAMHSAQGDMTMKMKGKLVGGDCDAAATRKKAEAIQKQAQENQAQADQAMAQGCDNAVEKVQFRLFSGPIGMCKKPEQIAKVCARMATRPGWAAYQENARDPEQGRIAKELCKKDPEQIRAKLCKQAATEAKGDDTPRDTLDFLAGNCPDETRVLAKKVCAGRKFTGMPENVRPICVQYAREELSGGKGKVQESSASEDQEQEQQQEEQPKDTKEKIKKGLLKGLFGN